MGTLDGGYSGLRGLGYVRRPAAGAMFDESSVSWHFASRWPVLVGGGAAVLYQVAHPAVGAGVAQHSSFERDPFGRLEHTLYAMLAISFGSPERREEVLDELRSMHQRVKGATPSGGSYRALDPSLQLWVWATLVRVALDVDRRYVRQLSRTDAERYYVEQTELARAFRVPDKMIPADLDAFDGYVDEVVAGLEVTDDARSVASSIVRPRVPFVPRSAMIPFELVTIDLLPTKLREGYGLPALSPIQRRFLRSSRAMSRALLPRLPEPLLANPLNRRAIA